MITAMSNKIKHPSSCSCMFCRGKKLQRKQERKLKEKEKAELEPREDQFNSDVEADADALASAGFGTNEDYGSASEVL